MTPSRKFARGIAEWRNPPKRGVNDRSLSRVRQRPESFPPVSPLRFPRDRQKPKRFRIPLTEIPGAPRSSAGTTLRRMSGSPCFALAACFAVAPVGTYFLPLGQGPRYFPASFTFIVIDCPSSTILMLKNPS